MADTEHGDREAAQTTTTGEGAQGTAAFFSDPRSSALLLTETVSRLIASAGISKGLIDLSTVAGVAVAEAFVRAGLPYDALEFGQEDRYASPADEGETVVEDFFDASVVGRYRSLGGTAEVEVASLGAIEARIVIVPAMVGRDEKSLDMTPGSRSGTVLTQVEELGRDLLFVETPERGLRLTADGTYERAVVHVRA